MSRTLLAALFLLAPSLLALARPAAAAWPNSPFVNLPVCINAGEQYSPAMVSDGAGGAFVVWSDNRTGGQTDIYAQHVLASGSLDPAWPLNGLPVCTAAFSQDYAAIVSDGASGAIVTWLDTRGFSHGDIYAQHILASGIVDPMWPVNGRGLCTTMDDQFYPAIATDGAGGAIVSWQDTRPGGGIFDIYAQRVLANGTVDPAWPVNGRAVCVAASNQISPQMVSDGTGGAIVTWSDTRSMTSDIYAQRVRANGTIDPAWPADGRALCTAVNDQDYQVIVADGVGGAIVTWRDARPGTTDIYAQRLLAIGAVDPSWPVDGRAVCSAANSQFTPRIATDGASGAIITWEDARTGDFDVYAHHVLANGTVDSAWPVDGRILCGLMGTQWEARVVSDQSGGAFVSWRDHRGGISDIYAQHILGGGTVDTSWPVNGRALSTAGGTQETAVLVADGSGGAVVGWRDSRNGFGTGTDIWAQRVARYGYLGTPEAEITAVTDVPNDQGGRLKVSWNASYLETDPYNLVTNYRVFRSVPPNVAALLRARGGHLIHASQLESEDLERPGDLLVTSVGATTYFWEYLATVNADFLSGYSYVAPTTGDSTAAGASTTAFMIQARTAGTLHWESTPRSGYSVDNLAPFAPAPFSGEYVAGTTRLHWDPNRESDLAGYRLHRGFTQGFVPGPGNLVATLSDTGYTDVAGTTAYYKLSAVDVHGNESPYTLLQPQGTTDVAGDESPTLYLAPPSPNPARASFTLRYTLSRASRVSLALYDPLGRRVRLLLQAQEEPGEHVRSFDAADDAGSPLASGRYFLQLDTQGQMIRRGLSIVR